MDLKTYEKFVSYSPKVAEALQKGLPIVALESTIITHGMEYPTNKDTALAVESVVEKNGAIPATIAILNGVIKVGLTNEDIDALAKAGKSCRKCSRRDLGVCLVKGENGSTTVAATMLIAHLAGIKIFATGGIGGVHRGAETTFDVSADLTELGRTPVAVVCAGAKSILDIPKTLEYLETQGVPVIGYQTDDFPMFFVTKSGYKASARLDSEAECAKLIKTTFDDLKLTNGMLFTIPVPKEEEANGETVHKAIEEALKEADAKGIKGAESTPFLLKRINEITGGESSKSNVALIKNNSALAARIAVQYQQLHSKK